MFIGFMFLFIEIPILAGMYLELAENLEQQEDLELGEENDTYQGSNLKADISVSFAKSNHANRITISILALHFSLPISFYSKFRPCINGSLIKLYTGYFWIIF